MLASPLTRIVACFLIGILLVFGIAAIGSLTLIMKLVLLLAMITGVGIWYVSLSHQPVSQISPSPVSTVALTRYDAPAFIRRGWVAWERGDDQAAIAAFEQAIQLNPDLAVAYIGRSRSHFQLGEISVAMADCQQAIQMSLNQPISFYQRGNLRYDLGDPTGAQADFARAIALEADSPESVGLATATDYYMRGVARYRSQDRAGAIADLEVAAQLSESMPEPRVHQQIMDLIREIQP